MSKELTFYGKEFCFSIVILTSTSYSFSEQLEVKNLALTLFGTASHPFKSFYNVTEKRRDDKTDLSDINYVQDEDLIDDEEEIVETANESYMLNLKLFIGIVLSISVISLCAIAFFHFRNRRRKFKVHYEIY
jgi:hypothetical protein